MLPCYKDRRALTFWISADYPNTTATTASVSYQSTSDSAAVSHQSTAAAAAAAITATTGTAISSATATNPAAAATTSTAAAVATASAINRSATAAPNLIPSKTSNKALIQESQLQLKRSPFSIPDIHPFSLPPIHWDEMTIFISIASYCDSECGPTVRDAYAQASCPGRVSVGVAWQGSMTGQWDWEGVIKRKGGKGEEGVGDVVCPSFMTYDAPSSSSSSSTSSSSSRIARGRREEVNKEVENDEDEANEGDEAESDGEAEEEEWVRAMKSNVRVSAIPSEQASGPCWARGVAFSMWRGERYLLQIDSHMRFRSGWDRYLVWQLEKTREEMMMRRDKEEEEEEEKEEIGEGVGEGEGEEQVENEANLGGSRGRGGDENIREKRQNSHERYQYENTKSNVKMNFKSVERSLAELTAVTVPAKMRMKPILTTYPLGYRLPNAVPADTRATLLVRYTIPNAQLH